MCRLLQDELGVGNSPHDRMRKTMAVEAILTVGGAVVRADDAETSGAAPERIEERDNFAVDIGERGGV